MIILARTDLQSGPAPHRALLWCGVFLLLNLQYNIPMDLTQKGNLKRLLNNYGLEPEKKWGQNFLISKDVVDLMVSAAELSSSDEVLEIGPGVGTLTKPLANNAGFVYTIEKDERFCKLLREQLEGFSNLEIIQGDIRDYLKGEKPLPIKKSYKVVSNLPFYISSFVLRGFLEAHQKPDLMVFLLQDKLARRVAACPGEKSLISLAVQLYGEPILVGSIVKREKLWPRPNVDCRIVKIDKIKSELDIDPQIFFKVARAGFKHKRKMLRNNLSQEFSLSKDELSSLFSKLSIDPKIRAQKLTLEQWKKLSTTLNQVFDVV